MKRLAFGLALSLCLAAPVLAADSKSQVATTPQWSMNATIIEACSCPMFCQCYFATKPAGHAVSAKKEGHDHSKNAGHAHGAKAGEETEHFCRANNVFKVNKGSYGSVKLDGAKFWAAMDLGDDFSDGTMKWAVITFDPSVTKAQREGITTILGHLYPVKWETPIEVAKTDLPIEWTHSGDRAVAKLDGGKAGEVVLNGGAVNRDKASPVVITNLKYWGAPRNTGFVLMPNEVEAYRLGPNAFEFKNTNGFMITFDITSKDLAGKAESSGGF
ncbi:MAG TPA: DUF1326 domain-containing protein [Candidatus Limnocylindria bacterium]|nr:DUF1326 domain-containing protein [Candidatus Limnocylindria bacterium]